MTSASVALQAYTPRRLREAVPSLSEVEARKFVAAVHRGTSIDGPVHQVRRESLNHLRALGSVPSLTIVRRDRSQLDPFEKLALRTHDGHVIETVRIPLEKPGRFTVCVSSQAGCALGCAFCATGRMGLIRNLEAWEMVEQVRLVRQSIVPPAQKIHGVVFQGMGEPLANVERLLTAIEVLSDPCAQAIDQRNVTVSTVGLPAGIRRLAVAAPKARLALSIHAVDPELRRRLLPIEHNHPLREVLAACGEHTERTGLSPMWSITMLAGVNDTAEAAGALCAEVEAFAARYGRRPRLSIIPFNPIEAGGAEFSRSEPEVVWAFRQVLHARGIPTHLRYSGGSDVAAACGQLAGAVAAD